MISSYVYIYYPNFMYIYIYIHIYIYIYTYIYMGIYIYIWGYYPNFMEVTSTVPPITIPPTAPLFPHLRPAASAWPRSAPAAPRCAAAPAGRRCSRSPPQCLDGNNNGDPDGDLPIYSLWIYMDLYMNLYEFIWIYMDLDCLVWIANQDLVFVSFSCYPKP